MTFKRTNPLHPMGETLSVIACTMPALPKGELLSSCRVSLFIIRKDRCFPSLLIKLPHRGSWQSRQALTERVQAAQRKDAFTRWGPFWRKCIFNIRCHCPLRPYFVKKSFRKIRRFFGSSNIKNKISAEDAQSETEGIQIVRSPERGRTSDNSFPARPTGSGDPEPAASPRSAAAGGAHPLPLHAAS